MGKCKYCERSGLFFKVTNNGLCPSCERAVIMSINSIVRVINDSNEIIQKSNNIETVISRFDVVTDKLNLLYKEYEHRDITTTKPKPSELLSKRDSERSELIVKSLDKEFTNLLRTVFELKTPKAQNNRIMKFIETKEKYKSQVENPDLLSDLENKIDKLLNQIKSVITN